MNDELKTDLKGSGRALIEVLSWHLSGENGGNHVKPQARFKPSNSEYKSTWPLDQIVRSLWYFLNKKKNPTWGALGLISGLRGEKFIRRVR
jgi:hypothetical protein